MQEKRKQETSAGGAPSFHLVQSEIHKKKESNGESRKWEFFLNVTVELNDSCDTEQLYKHVNIHTQV